MSDHLDDMDLAALTREAERLGATRFVGPRETMWGLGAGTRAAQTRDGWGGRWRADGGWLLDEADALRWLLRTDEAQARAACYARGVADERARAVAWLRSAGDEAERAAASMSRIGDRMAAGWYIAQANGLRHNADVMERGDHEAGR